ncbi:unnamed protein product [Arctia plantaginis]|uniref:Uncharacterized protein n=1 Tax=Arctia plantaginis TaxID=874455 RepID=A0A8S0YML3_ARCPL|nr:unnamed protein product [Arctia plantaginis]
MKPSSQPEASSNMAFLNTIRYLLLSHVVVYAIPYNNNINYLKAFEENCNKLITEPYFEPELVLGRSWRIYYAWNMDLEEKCLDMVFTNATQAIVNRVYNDMVDYLEMQPFWDAATLLVSMGQARHEMLLFVDQGAAGRFIGVPNVVRDGNISPSKNAVPLIRIHMKLLYNAKYLVMSDCTVGVSTLSARRDSDIYRAEIQGVASTLDFGLGSPACIGDYNNEETKLDAQ